MAKRTYVGLRQQVVVLVGGQVPLHRVLRLGRQQCEDHLRRERFVATSFRHFGLLFGALLDRLDDKVRSPLNLACDSVLIVYGLLRHAIFTCDFALCCVFEVVY